jgi:maltooligosyltrehalose trehalohydrolase
MVSPFIPMLFMGEEWSAPSPFLYFVSHTDPELVEAVRKGRKAEFAAFHTEGETPDPQSRETFERSKLQWELIDEDDHQQMLDYYQTLITLRKQLRALSKLNRKNLKTTVNEEKQILLLERWDENQHVCCLMNFSDSQQLISLPVHSVWKKVLDSADGKWNGPGLSVDNIQPQSIIIYISSHV